MDHPKPILLTRSDVAQLLSMSSAVAAVEVAFAAYGRGEAVMPAKVYLPLAKEHGDFRAMPAYLEGAAGVKWVNSHPENPARFGLPTVMGLYILSDPATALPLAVLDATRLTAVRTGAAAAVATKYLARRDLRSMGFIGCGVQARFLLDAHRALLGDTFEVVAADVDLSAAVRFAEEAGGRAAGIAEAAGCDVVCTATTSRKPVVLRGWIKAGAHINAMGADGPGKQELDAAILRDAKVVIDDWHQATESGEVNVPLRDGGYLRESIFGTLGEIIAGKRVGRVGDEISVFDSTGLAIQDVALARAIVAEARARGVGVPFDFGA